MEPVAWISSEATRGPSQLLPLSVISYSEYHWASRPGGIIEPKMLRANACALPRLAPYSTAMIQNSALWWSPTASVKKPTQPQAGIAPIASRCPIRKPFADHFVIFWIQRKTKQNAIAQAGTTTARTVVSSREKLSFQVSPPPLPAGRMYSPRVGVPVGEAVQVGERVLQPLQAGLVEAPRAPQVPVREPVLQRRLVHEDAAP